MTADRNRDWLATIGLWAIIDQLGLKVPKPTVRSEISAGGRKTRITNTQVLEQYPRAYAPASGIIGQLKFALKHEPIDVGVYKAAFTQLEKGELEKWVQSEPNGVFARRAWYLYELLTGETFDLPDLTSGPYIDLLNQDMHIAGSPIRIRRQRVFDNLLGNKDYCPLIRRTDKLKAGAGNDLSERAQALIAGVDPAVLRRAVHYLFTKETKSTFAIEGEAPGRDRTERFVAALMHAERFDPTRKGPFIQLQNAIVDSRYAQTDWRTTQVYVGETLPDYSEQVHFACPRPGDVGPLMDGWMRMMMRLLDPESAVHPVCAAAAAAFGFVFVHPFLDGNGRIHRFLVHNMLARKNFTPPGVLFPVSAAMLRDMAAYDRVLEGFSGLIHSFVEYTMDAEQQMKVLNDTADLYRFFDATTEAEYLFDCIADTIGRDLKTELEFLKFFDMAIRSVMEIVDMPNQRASLLVRIIHQNQGRLSKGKRQMFSELTDEEIARIELSIRKAGEQAEETKA